MRRRSLRWKRTTSNTGASPPTMTTHHDETNPTTADTVANENGPYPNAFDLEACKRCRQFVGLDRVGISGQWRRWVEAVRSVHDKVTHRRHLDFQRKLGKGTMVRSKEQIHSSLPLHNKGEDSDPQPPTPIFLWSKRKLCAHLSKKVQGSEAQRFDTNGPGMAVTGKVTPRAAHRCTPAQACGIKVAEYVGDHL